MITKSASFWMLIAVAVILFSCNSNKPQTPNVETDPMKQKIGVVMEELTIGSPQGGLGNLVADAMLGFGESKIDEGIRFAFIDNASIKGKLSPGPVTAEEVYALFEKDQRLSMVVMKGAKVKELFALIGASLTQGTPEATYAIAGGRIRMAKNNLKDMSLNGQPIQDEAEYRLLTTGAVINGGQLPLLNQPGVQELASKFTLQPSIVEFIQTNGMDLSSKIDDRLIMEF